MVTAVTEMLVRGGVGVKDIIVGLVETSSIRNYDKDLSNNGTHIFVMKVLNLRSQISIVFTFDDVPTANRRHCVACRR